jgi:hypothetical protein
MKSGDTVMIYYAPVGKMAPEGRATLLDHLETEDDPEIGERWTVRFEDGDIRDRWV